MHRTEVKIKFDRPSSKNEALKRLAEHSFLVIGGGDVLIIEATQHVATEIKHALTGRATVSIG